MPHINTRRPASTPMKSPNQSIRLITLFVASIALSLPKEVCAQALNYPRVPQVAHNSPLIGTQLVDPQFNPQTGHMYLRTSAALGKSAAQALAREVGGYLVCIQDAAENNWLLGTYGATQFFWIGLSDEGHEGRFTWESGEPFGYSNWGTPQEPNNCNSSVSGCRPENDVVFNQHRPGGWNDMSRIYAGPFPAIIEVPALYLGLYARGQSSGSFGHAFISLVYPLPSGYTDFRFGLYPTRFGDPLVISEACVHFEAATASRSGTPWECRILYWVSPQQFYSTAISVFLDMSQNATCPSRTGFSFLIHNCTDWATDKLAAGGIVAPSHTFAGVSDPDALVVAMHAMSGVDRPDCNGGSFASASGPQALSYSALTDEALTSPNQLAARFGLVSLQQSLPPVTAFLGSPLTVRITGIAPTNAAIVTDWGDGALSYQGDLAHSYNTAAVYSVRIVIVDQGSVTHYSSLVTITAGTGSVMIPVNHTVGSPSTWLNTGIDPATAFPLPASSLSVGPACGRALASGLFATAPILGQTLKLSATNNASTVMVGALLFGSEANSPLPIPGGCSSYVDYTQGFIGVPQSITAQSLEETTLLLPNDPALLGARIAVEVVSLDGASSLATSNAMILLLGT